MNFAALCLDVFAEAVSVGESLLAVCTSNIVAVTESLSVQAAVWTVIVTFLLLSLGSSNCCKQASESRLDWVKIQKAISAFSSTNVYLNILVQLTT